VNSQCEVTNFESPLVLATVALIDVLLLILMMGVTMSCMKLGELERQHDCSRHRGVSLILTSSFTEVQQTVSLAY